jgi:hypothetical protein
MSKKVELIIEIDEKGKITVTPKGTVGPECLDLMKFLDKIEDFNVLETIFNEDMNKEKSKINNKVIKKIQKPKS